MTEPGRPAVRDHAGARRTVQPGGRGGWRM